MFDGLKGNMVKSSGGGIQGGVWRFWLEQKWKHLLWLPAGELENMQKTWQYQCIFINETWKVKFYQTFSLSPFCILYSYRSDDLRTMSFYHFLWVDLWKTQTIFAHFLWVDLQKAQSFTSPQHQTKKYNPCFCWRFLILTNVYLILMWSHVSFMCIFGKENWNPWYSINTL